MGCLRLRSRDIPEGDWFCPSCEVGYSGYSVSIPSCYMYTLPMAQRCFLLKPPEKRTTRNPKNMREADSDDSNSENDEDVSTQIQTKLALSGSHTICWNFSRGKFFANVRKNCDYYYLSDCRSNGFLRKFLNPNIFSEVFLYFRKYFPAQTNLSTR